MKNGSWFDHHTKEVVNMDSLWFPGQPNGEDLENCLQFKVKSGQFIDSVCSGKEECFVCSWKTEPTFFLRGLCSNAKVDREYVLLPNLSYDSQVVFMGFGNSNVVFSQKMKSWLIVQDKLEDLFSAKEKSNSMINVMGMLTPDPLINQLPTGLQLWNITGCKGHQWLKLTSVILFKKFGLSYLILIYILFYLVQTQ